MTEEQASFVGELPRLLQVLSSGDVDGDGNDRPVSDPIRFIEHVTCVATTGTSGCGWEQQLESVLEAVSPGLPTDLTALGLRSSDVRPVDARACRRREQFP